MHPYSAQVLTERDAFVDGHRSRMVDAGMLRATDVILTATREHRAFIARMLPAAIGRTFTVRQFARLAAAVEPVESRDATELGHRLLVEAKAARALLQPVPPEDDDLADPMGGPVEAFETCAVVLSESVQAIMNPLHLL
jgi:protein-tyrosine phosphatase